MSTDFSVKPVGVSAPSLVIRPAPEAARDGVRTQLPAAQSVTASETAKPAHRQSLRIDSERLSRQMVFDQDSAEMVYQVVDERTESVVQQVPDEAKRRARAYFREMERAKEADRPQFTDRTV